MGEEKTGQNGEDPRDQQASQDFKPVDRDSRSQADYGGSMQHRDEDSTGSATGASRVREGHAGDETAASEPSDGPTTQHTGP